MGVQGHRLFHEDAANPTSSQQPSSIVHRRAARSLLKVNAAAAKAPAKPSPSPQPPSPSPKPPSPSPKPLSPSPLPTSPSPSPAPSTLPTSTGLAGGWSIDWTTYVAGARFLHTINADKDGSIVASRVASALGGLANATSSSIPATSDTRRLYMNPTRMSDANYVEEVADYIVNGLYKNLSRAGNNPLLGKSTVVLTSVHRYGLYVAEALHAQLLPLQFISFADSWDQIHSASSKATIIAGQDGDYSGMWLWNKLAAGAAGTPAADLPAAYRQALATASNVVVVQPCDNWVYCNPATDPNGYECWDAINETYTGGSYGNIFLHTSITRGGGGVGKTLYNSATAAGLVGKASQAEVKNLKQWEWGVPDSTISNLQAIWTGMGKSLTNFKVISSGVVDMFASSPDIWSSYLTANGVAPRGFHWSSYFVAHTQLERMGAILPFPSYSYYQPGWHPLDDKARSVLTSLGVATATQAQKVAYAANSRGFVNNVGSSTDNTGTKQVMTDYGLVPENGLGYYMFGFDCSDASTPEGWTAGSTVQQGYITVAQDLQDPSKAPYSNRSWVPLTFASLASLPSVCGAWTPY